MFNDKGLIFLNKNILENVRNIPLDYIYLFFGLWFILYMSRSYSIWVLARTLNLRGFWFSFIPILRVFLFLSILRKSLGYSLRSMVFFRLLAFTYFLGIGFSLVSPSPRAVVTLILASIAIYYLLWYLSLGISVGLIGSYAWWWGIALIGSFVMVFQSRKARRTNYYIKPYSLDGLFTKFEDMELEL